MVDKQWLNTIQRVTSGHNTPASRRRNFDQVQLPSLQKCNLTRMGWCEGVLETTSTPSKQQTYLLLYFTE